MDQLLLEKRDVLETHVANLMFSFMYDVFSAPCLCTDCFYHLSSVSIILYSELCVIYGNSGKTC